MRFTIKTHRGGKTYLEGEFSNIADAKTHVSIKYPDFVLTNDENGYIRYLWGGYPEGLDLFIVSIDEPCI
jgi:hypothetical protein